MIVGQYVLRIRKGESNSVIFMIRGCAAVVVEMREKKEKSPLRQGERAGWKLGKLPASRGESRAGPLICIQTFIFFLRTNMLTGRRVAFYIFTFLHHRIDGGVSRKGETGRRHHLESGDTDSVLKNYTFILDPRFITEKFSNFSLVYYRYVPLYPVARVSTKKHPPSAD